MAKTTEELRREMYEALDVLKYAIRNTPKPLLMGLLENSTEAYLEALHQDHDDLRKRLKAFEFANKSAGELLRDALATVKRQREFISTLYTSRNARKIRGGTSGQKKNEDGATKIPHSLAVCPASFIEINCKKGNHFTVKSSVNGIEYCLACGEKS